jgi:adenylylsulfate kinase-like enzyme
MIPNLGWQAIEVNKAARCEPSGHGSGIVWFTGISGSGKSTIASLAEKRLHTLGMRTYLLDGDSIRLGLNKDLGFANADRAENIRRTSEVAKLMTDAGLLVLVSLISPFREERRMDQTSSARSSWIRRSRSRNSEIQKVFTNGPAEVSYQTLRVLIHRMKFPSTPNSESKRHPPHQSEPLNSYLPVCVTWDCSRYPCIGTHVLAVGSERQKSKQRYLSVRPPNPPW